MVVTLLLGDGRTQSGARTTNLAHAGTETGQPQTSAKDMPNLQHGQRHGEGQDGSAGLDAQRPFVGESRGGLPGQGRATLVTGKSVFRR